MTLSTRDTLNIYRAFWKKAWSFSLALTFLVVAQIVSAAPPNRSPYDVVQFATDQLMTTVTQYSSSYEKDPERFYTAVESALEPVVDFQRISRIVMDRYYKLATKEQRDRFALVFKRKLVTTYAKGLVNYSGLEIVTLSPSSNSEGMKKIGVRQEVHAEEGILPISYTMMRNRSGEWKVLNIILNGVNLGKIFRNQFLQALRKSDGDIDRVIETWTVQA